MPKYKGDETFIKFKKTTKMVTNPQTKEKKRSTVMIPILRKGGLTEEIINTGNLETLNKFYQDNKKTLNKEEKAYMEVRIHSAMAIREAREKGLSRIGNGESSPTYNVDLDLKTNTVGLNNIKPRHRLNTKNGDWSLAYSLLLQSRGILLNQEDIRAWRPEQGGDALINSDASYKMNSDSQNSIFDMAGLLTEVLPNSTMNQLTLDPLDTSKILVDGKAPNENDINALHYCYRESVKSTLVDTIRKALNEDHSPLAVWCADKYIVITGISADGKTIRYEDLTKFAPQRDFHIGGSQKNREEREKQRKRDDAERSTQKMNIETLLDDGLNRQMDDDMKFVPGKGIRIEWIHEPDRIPNFEDTEEVEADLNEEHVGLVGTDPDGNVVFDNVDSYPNVSELPPTATQTNGKALSTKHSIDMTDSIENSDLKGKAITGIDITKVGIGAINNYYPNKIHFIKDPSLKKDIAPKKIRKEVPKKELDIIEEDIKINEDIKIDNNEDNIDNDNIIDTRSNRNLNKIHEDDIIINVDNKKKDIKINNDDIKIEIDDDEEEMDVEDAAYEILKGNDEFNNNGVDNSVANDAEFNRNLNKYWDRISRNPERVRVDVRRDALAKIIAMNELRAEKVKAGDQHPRVTSEEIHTLAKKIESDRLFIRLVSNGNDLELAKKRDLNKVIKGLKDEFKNKDDKDYRYHLPSYDSYKEYTSGVLGSVVSFLDYTETGTYTNFGIIKRSKNSARYDAAYNAVMDVYSKGITDSERLMQAADTVKEYLKDKMTTRHRDFGNIRFQQFMTFLHHVMPSDEFEYLCYEVNKARGVVNKPGSSDYVAPESFMHFESSASKCLDDVRSRIEFNRGSSRDYAFIIALRNECDDDGKFEKDVVFDKPESMRRITKATERILKTPQFKAFMTELTEEERQALIGKQRKFILNFEDGFNVQKVKNKLQAINAKDQVPVDKVKDQPQAKGIKK